MIHGSNTDLVNQTTGSHFLVDPRKARFFTAPLAADDNQGEKVAQVLQDAINHLEKGDGASLN